MTVIMFSLMKTQGEMHTCSNSFGAPQCHSDTPLGYLGALSTTVLQRLL